MSNKTPETDLMEGVKSFCQHSEKRIKLYNCNCNSRNFMDFEAEINLSEKERILLRCEAKVASQTDGKEYKEKFNTVHKVFGEILKGRSLKPDNYTKCENIVYGFLIHKRDFDFYKEQYRRLIKDWNQFGRVFECKFVVVFNSSEEKLDIYRWEDCWINPVKEYSFSIDKIRLSESQ